MTKKKSEGPLKPEDEDLWAFATRDIEPMKARPKAPDVEKPASDAPARLKVSRPPSTPRKAPSPSPSAKPEAAPGSGVDGRTAQRLKRGQLRIDGKLDLHGMTQAQAHSALDSFIARGYAQGKRCVLVVTGKGGKGVEDPDNIFVDRRTGVLRSMVPKWLNEGGNRARVLSVTPAQTRHGGDGALYVLLRRKR